MAYAKLIFPANTSVQRKLKDIARVCTGAATAVNQLEFVTQASSELIATEPAGWTMADAASALEVAGTATINEYRLQAPCVDTNKIKYCALSLYAGQGFYSSGQNQTVTNPRPSAGATSGAIWVPIGSGVSGNALTNSIWFLNSVTTQTNVLGATYTDNSSVSLSGTEFYISVTNRKLVIFSPTGANGSSIIMILEFPETNFTTTWNNVPFINISLNNATSAPVASHAPLGSGHTINTTNSISVNTNTTTGATLNIYRNVSVTNWYSVLDSVRANRFATDGNSNIFMPTTAGQTYLNNNLVYPLLPFIDFRTSRGEGVFNFSTLTDMYYTYRTSTYAASGDELTVGSDTYVVLSVGSGTGNYRSIAIKKA